MDPQTLLQITVSLALGLLLGLQRQRTEASIAGIRTFPCISVFGTVCAMIAEVHGGWLIGAGFLSLAGILIFANYLQLRAGNVDAGMTTEVAVLLLYALGVLVVIDQMPAAVVIGGVMMLLLHLKDPMHRFAAAVGSRDMRAIAFFVLFTLIILPVLPNEPMGPYGLWNPFSLWLMVVLIVGISLAGYVAWKLFGGRKGALLGGFIGGLISSTATTVSFARRSASDAAVAPLAAFIIMAASCTSVFRVLVEIGAAAPGTVGALVPPLAVMLGACAAIAAVLYLLSRREEAEMPEQKNPAELKPALIFGALYAGVIVAVAAAREHFGSAGLYTVAALSGLTDVDAIALSSARLAGSGEIATSAAWRAILIAITANFFFKFGVIAAVGGAALTRRITLAFAGAVAASALLLWLWPW